MTITTYTPDDFAKARFATHPDGRIAARVDPNDGLPWIATMPRGGRAYRTDEDMAADGFIPLDETRLPRVVTDDECPYCDERAEPCEDQHTRMGYMCSRPYGHIGKHVACGEDEHEVARWGGAAPTSDEGDPPVDYHAMWWKAEREREQAEAFAARWKETARRLWQSREDYARFEDGHKAMIMRQRVRVADAEARAERAEWERDNARHSRDLWVEAVEKAEARAEKAEQEREGLRVALEKATVERNRAELRVEDLESMTARDLLNAAWEAAHVPADGTIPKGSRYITHFTDTGEYKVQCASFGPIKARGSVWENRLLDPPTPKRPARAEEFQRIIADRVAGDLPDDVIRALADDVAVKAGETVLWSGEDGDER